MTQNEKKTFIGDQSVDFVEHEIFDQFDIFDILLFFDRNENLGLIRIE